MRERCYYKKHNHYKNYGGRGIKVCERWLERGSGFSNFVLDMSKKPTRKHSIDRIDNNGDYTPENCKWSTQKQQVYNSSASKMLTIDGITDNKSGHMNRYGINPNTVFTRTSNGMTFEEAIKKPLDRLFGLRKYNKTRVAAKRNACPVCQQPAKTSSRIYCSRKHYFSHRYGK